jgi:ferrous iron transport protein A
VKTNWTQAIEIGRREDARCEVCPLNRVRAGVAVRIKQLCAAPEVQNRLREIGFCEDQIIRLLTSQTNFICQVCNARLAISEQLAKLILVEPLRQEIPRR